jgi:hypothetical protein
VSGGTWRVRGVPAWRAVALACVLAGCAGQDLMAQRPKPKARPAPTAGVATPARPTATVLVSADRACTVSVDGDARATVHPDQPVRVAVAVGEHLFEAVDATGARRWQETVRVASATQQVVLIRFVDAEVHVPSVRVPLDGRLEHVAPGQYVSNCGMGRQCASAAQARRVVISRPTWALASPVSAVQFRAYLSEQGARLRTQPAQRPPTAPVVNVTWEEAVGFCTWMQGRLPSEAEAEWIAYTLGPPRMGVWEWTADWHARDRPQGHVVDPRGPSSGLNRVVIMPAAAGEPVRRDGLAPQQRYDDVGFRCVTDRAP